jgi:hypothetical protein
MPAEIRTSPASAPIFGPCPRRVSYSAPCLPRPAKAPPAGPGWIHEIKHDGYRIVAERDHGSVKLYTRNGYDFADRSRWRRRPSVSCRCGPV